METVSEQYLSELYPDAIIRAARISRLGDKYIGPVWSTAETCRMIGEENIGWFVGGFATIDCMVNRLRQLDQASFGGRWIVVPATRKWADTMMTCWAEGEDATKDCPKTIRGYWHGGNVTVCLIESLSELAVEIDQAGEAIAGIILCDPRCIVHRSRGFQSKEFRVRHDRPQQIVDFRNRLAVGRWSPPLIVMSLCRPGAISASRVQQAYCLEAFQFLDGQTIICNPQVQLANPSCCAEASRAENIATGA